MGGAAAITAAMHPVAHCLADKVKGSSLRHGPMRSAAAITAANDPLLPLLALNIKLRYELKGAAAARTAAHLVVRCLMAGTYLAHASRSGM